MLPIHIVTHPRIMQVSLEVVFGALTILGAILTVYIKLERRLTKIETKIEDLPCHMCDEPERKHR